MFSNKIGDLSNMTYKDLIQNLVISKQKELEHFESLDLAFEKTNIGLCFVSPTGKFLHVNEASCKILKRTKEELLNLTFQDITKEEFVQEDVEQVQNLLDNGEVNSYTLTKCYVDKDGNDIPVLLEVTSVLDEYSEKVKYFISKIIDLKEMEKCSRALRLRNKK